MTSRNLQDFTNPFILPLYYFLICKADLQVVTNSLNLPPKKWDVIYGQSFIQTKLLDITLKLRETMLQKKFSLFIINFRFRIASCFKIKTREYNAFVEHKCRTIREWGGGGVNRAQFFNF